MRSSINNRWSVKGESRLTMDFVLCTRSETVQQSRKIIDKCSLWVQERLIYLLEWMIDLDEWII